MTILDIYKEKNKDSEWFRRHCSSGKKSAGRFFEYTNTNFRTQASFIQQFKKFLVTISRPRGEWPVRADTGQELDKHRVVNMLQSKLFMKAGESTYRLTEKGNAYSRFIEQDISSDERWLLNYLFLSNGYYLQRKNYIIDRVQEDLLGHLLSVPTISRESLVKDARDIISSESFRDAVRKPFFYQHSFYDDPEFLDVYLRSSAEDREALAVYIEHNISSRNLACCISKKYKSTGIFDFPSLIDESKVFLLTLLFLNSKDINPEHLGRFFSGCYHKYIGSVDKERVQDYISSEIRIFNPIFIEILGLDAVDGADVFDFEDTLEPVLEDGPEAYIDETSEEGKQRIKSIYKHRKKQALISSAYTCELESMNNCRPLYFTAKVSKKNYLELHHFIPREFRNDFAYSIEVLANYVALCPRCHKQIHLAVDRERKHLVNYLYTQRIHRLELVGLEKKLKEIYEYYKID